MVPAIEEFMQRRQLTTSATLAYLLRARDGIMPPVDLRLPARYELAADPSLGRGGMGQVYRARDRVLDLPVAIKVVRSDLAADPRFRKLFELEVRTSARFSHPRIVPLHDHGSLEDGTPWLGLALADAGSLATLENENWAEILRLFLELLDGLAHIHARGVLHRDLKPENVLLWTDPEGVRHVWLADLGLANASLQLAKRAGRREGTPGYMSPEQSMGLPREFGPWTDIYAVGVMLWKTVTGGLPLAEHLTTANADLPTLEPRPGLAVPAGLALVLKNCLDPEPLSRYDLVADLRTELLALGDPTHTRGDFDGPEERHGTVAPAANTLRGALSETLATLDAGPDSTPDLDPYVPIWNRPMPPKLPDQVVSESGRGVSARASLQLFAMRELPLVARDRERQVLWEQAIAVREARQARVVLVVGAAGSGKTHLVDSVLRSLEEGGWAESVHLPYQNPRGAEDGYFGAARAILRPWKETSASLVARLRRRLARERGILDVAVKEEANLLARWCGVVDQIEDQPVPPGFGLREVYRHLDARSWRGLSVMVLEDAHHALEDGDGLWLAESMATSPEIRPTLVIATLRSEALERDPQLRARVQALVESGAVRLDLDLLDKERTLEVIGECLELTPELANQAAERCEGNPLFARQLLLEWANRDWLVQEGAAFHLKPGVDASEVLPTDARTLLQQRVDGLSEASGNHRRFRDAVHMGAMAGQAVPRDLLTGLVGEELEEYLLGCGLFVEKEDRLRFQSNLLHQAVRTQADERKDAAYLHRRLGRAWVKYGETSGHDVNLQVGRHSMIGRDFGVAIEALLLSAEHSWHRRHSDELAESTRLAVEACYRSPQIADKTGWANLWRGRAHQLRGEADRASQFFLDAIAYFQGQKEEKGSALAHIGEGWAQMQMGRLAESETAYGEGLRISRELEDVAVETLAVHGLAWLEQQKRNFDGAEILFTRAANWSSKHKDLRAQGEALLGQAYVSRRRGEFDEANDIYNDAVEVFQEADDLLGVARAWIGKGTVLRQRSTFDEAEALYQRAYAVAEELGATEIVMEARYWQAEIARRTGNHDRALRTYNKQLVWAMANKKREMAILAEFGIGMVDLARDDLIDLYERTNAVSRMLADMPAHWLWATYRLLVAAMLAHRLDEAQTYSWLWSASELGIADGVDEDVAYLLTDITAIAIREDWRNVLRVAGRLAGDQLRKLGDPEGAAFVKAQMDRVLTTR